MMQSPSSTRLPPPRGAISPQTLLREANAEGQPMVSSAPTVVTRRFFEPPPLRTAPASIRWAYALSWIVVVTTLFPHLFRHHHLLYSTTLSALFWVAQLWSTRGLKEGNRVAWYLQIPLAFVGLFSFSWLSILAYGYVLSQWFKPEVRRWFDLH